MARLYFMILMSVGPGPASVQESQRFQCAITLKFDPTHARKKSKDPKERGTNERWSSSRATINISADLKLMNAKMMRTGANPTSDKAV